MTRMTDTLDNTLRKPGRPSSYTPELGIAICARLASGESLRSIGLDEALPHRATIMAWLHRHEDFRRMYTAARELGAEAMADEVVAMAMAAKPEEANAVRVAVDAVKWAAAKFAPKRWGDRITAEVTGAGGGPVTLQAMPAMLVPAQVASAVRDLIAKAEAEMGLPAGTGTDQERLRAIMASAKPLPPDVYEIVHSRKE
jgi:hypothetical protein